MIKKIVFLLTLLLALIVPAALANDGGSRPDTERVSFDYTIISEEVNIGEAFEFSIKIKNHTSREAELITLGQVFAESFDTDSLDEEIKKVVIEPFQTITLDVSYIVPTTINWYEKNGSYYVDFQPEVYYFAKEAINGQEVYHPNDDYWDYYQMSKWAIPVKIANLNDGSEYAAISIVDDKTIIGFNDSAYKASASWNGELVGEVYNRLEVENTSDLAFDEFCVYKKGYYYDDYLEINSLNPEQAYEFNHSTYYYLLENDIPKNISIDYKMIFAIDGTYYCTYTTREYKTQIFPLPDVSLLRMETYDSETMEYSYTYLIENISGKDIENFAVFYELLYEDYDTVLKEFEDRLLHGTFEKDDRWLIPVNVSDGYHFIITIGYVVEETFYHNTIQSNYYYSRDDNNLSVGYCGYEGSKWDLYEHYHAKKIEDLLEAETTTAPENTPVITPVPTAASTTEVPIESTPSTVSKRNSYFISPYVFIALVLSLMAVAIVQIFKWKKRNEEVEESETDGEHSGEGEGKGNNEK